MSVLSTKRSKLIASAVVTAALIAGGSGFAVAASADQSTRVVDDKGGLRTSTDDPTSGQSPTPTPEDSSRPTPPAVAPTTPVVPGPVIPSPTPSVDDNPHPDDNPHVGDDNRGGEVEPGDDHGGDHGGDRGDGSGGSGRGGHDDGPNHD
jgi:hypothetical protein